ncbi:hypothetical protein [Yersinia massiliensis]|uniref:hypothetical protein n=1 Tax=Yersinia massiliensis TaxID=419257 RepID=UPI0011A61E28|nr:hypothetical protein [Yersinia massiliensis]
MGLIIKNCFISECNKGVVAPDSLDIDITGTVFEKTGVAIDIYPSSQELRQVGLPENTPKELLAEAIETLKKLQSSTTEEKQAAISKSKLFNWLSNGASIATVTTAVMEMIKFFR